MTSLAPDRAAPSTGTLVGVRAVTKTFREGDGATVMAVRGASLAVPAGATVAITGPSGSGKSTLLHLIGALERPDSGSIIVGGLEITRLGPVQSADYRRRTGFVFQQFNLLPVLTALDNVTAPLMPFRTGFDKRARARELLDAVGLAERSNTLASRLSGGQQQRIAIARALVNQPPLILADEPTGNLDSATGADIIDLLFEIRAREGTTIILATHDPELAGRCDQQYTIRDGSLHAAGGESEAQR